MTMAPDLDLGIDGEPQLMFQPAADLTTGRLLGFEALLRWHDGGGGYLSPETLLSWAESNGHAAELNAWVLAEACGQAARWPLGLQIAVNCSPFQLGGASAALGAARALDSSGLMPDRLTIEVTEPAIEDEDAFAELETMARLGLQLTVDDVGMDLSVLEELRRSIFNTIKIDETLTWSLDASNDSSRSIVEEIVDTSRSMGVCTVAEAVETADQVTILRELGTDVAQGYFFSAPVDAEEACALATGEHPPSFALAARSGRRSRAQLKPRRRTARSWRRS
jgi:EAL domain-containing protein (putative c-di-GMP-specific phosphodiesterase class I)